MQRDFPISTDTITAEWLNEALRECGHLLAGEVAFVEAEPIGEGAGMVARVARLHLAQSTGERIGCMIAKFPTAVVGNRAVAATFQVYEREVGFYRSLAPSISTAPHCYFANIDPSGDFLLLMEDGSALRPGDQVIGASLRDAELAVDAAAELHAAFWSSDARPEADWVISVNGDVHRPAMSAGVIAGWAGCMRDFGDVVDPELVGMEERFVRSLPWLHEAMSAGAQTLIHGDFRLDNMMFDDCSADRPIFLFDWQSILVSKGTHDVAFFLTQNLPVDLAREEEERLVQRYYERLIARGVKDYAWDECWQDYRLSSLYVFNVAVLICGTLARSDERATRFMRELIRRSSAATKRVLDLLPS